MKENYTEYVKIERKINKIDMEILELDSSDVFKNFLIKYGVNYGVKFAIGISLFLVTVLNRKQAVIVFSEKFDFAPFSQIISYPSNIENSISLPFWVFVNNYVFRQIASKLN
jgi:CHD5-like protein